MENPKTLLIRNVVRPDGNKSDILIKGDRFENIEAPSNSIADRTIDAEGKAILPPFYNGHTHAAMSLLRGYADDMPLFKWLTEYIWPFEEKLSGDDISRGSRLAALEMLKSGTVFFNDMYFDIDRTIEVVDKMGMRACIGVTVMESHSKADTEAKFDLLRNWQDPSGGRISLSVAPHAIYTVGPEKLKDCARISREKNIKLHIHISETEKEVADCIKEHGKTPVRYLYDLGLLSENTIAAHCVWMNKEEFEILRDNGVTIAHCPASNMKLGSGRFKYELALETGVKVSLATDGASSNNCLDMREEMKLAALFAKSAGDPTLLPAEKVFEWATRNGAEAFGIDGGVIANGKKADAILVYIGNERMQPMYNLISNWVYAADSSYVDTVICNGRIIMEGRKVAEEKEILESIKL